MTLVVLGTTLIGLTVDTSRLQARQKPASAGALTVRPQLLRLSPAYRRARDSILRPHLRLTESRYFWEKWKPRLGADAAVLIMEVRDRCNRALGSLGGSSSGTSGSSISTW